MNQEFRAIFENGVLRPLEPLCLEEREVVRILVERPDREESDDYLSPIVENADSVVTLEQVQAALAKIPGSMALDICQERADRI